MLISVKVSPCPAPSHHTTPHCQSWACPSLSSPILYATAHSALWQKETVEKKPLICAAGSWYLAIACLEAYSGAQPSSFLLGWGLAALWPLGMDLGSQGA